LDAVNDLAKFKAELDVGFAGLVGKRGFEDRFPPVHRRRLPGGLMLLTCLPRHICLRAGALAVVTLACGCGDGANGPGDPNGGRTIQTGPEPAHLVASSGDLFWSETSEAPIRALLGGARSPVTLAARFSVPAGLSVTGTDIYWTGERSGFAPSGCAGPRVIRTLNRTDRVTGATVLLAEGDGCSGGTGDVVVGGGNVYWVTSTSSPNTWTLQKLALAGGTPTGVILTSVPIVALAHDATHLYWMENDQTVGTGLWRVPLAGGTLQPLALSTGSRTGSFALHGSDLYFTVALYPGGEEVRRIPLAGGTPTAIDTLPAPPLKLLADATHLYLADADSIYSLPVTGGTPVRLAGVNDPPLDLILDGATLLWSEATGPAHGETGTIRRVPIGGGPVVTELSAGGDAPRSLAVSGGTIYWTEGGPVGDLEGFGQIASQLPGTGRVDTVASGVLSDSPPIDVNGGYVYVADKWRVKRVPRTGGRVQTITRADDQIESLATDGASVFWAQRPLAKAFRAAAAGGAPVPLGTPPPASTGPAGPIHALNGWVYWMSGYSAILRVPAAGGQVTPLATGLPFLSDLVVDDDYVYFSEQDGSNINRIPVGGGAPAFIASGTRFSYKSLALDATNLYWIDQVNVGRVAKAGGNIAYLNPNSLVTDPGFPASIAVRGQDLAWTHPPVGVIQIVPK
jgi:hypothetical protein